MFSKIFNSDELPSTENVMVLRVDYSDDGKWGNLKEEISKPDSEYGFLANVNFYENRKFDKLPLDLLLPKLSSRYNHPIILIADEITFGESETTLNCVDLVEVPGQYLRVITSEVWSIENNLSISNMEFQDFADAQDESGVFRGF
jgi:hypothetical protein